ncbi:MAG: pyruvate formate lyase family protein [Faecalibacillus sp.]
MKWKKAIFRPHKKIKRTRLKHTPRNGLGKCSIINKGFKESEGQPLAIQKAYSFRKQCTEKTVKIWDDELIVGNSEVSKEVVCLILIHAGQF